MGSRCYYYYFHQVTVAARAALAASLCGSVFVFVAFLGFAVKHVILVWLICLAILSWSPLSWYRSVILFSVCNL